MAWLDQLQPASFRGVPFQVDQVDHQAGDNVVLREYPFADLPTVFRMGEAAEEIKFTAYVVGPDYMLQRDRLRAVLSGQGELVHPTAGRLQVWVAGKYQLREAPTTEGGVCRFDLTFVRAEPRRYPQAEQDGAASAREAAQDAATAAESAFAAAWTLDGQPGWVAEAALERVRAQLASTWSVLAGATATLTEANASLLRNYNATTTALASLARTPRQLAAQVRLMMELPADMSQGVLRSVHAAVQGLGVLGQSTPARAFEVRVVPPVDGPPVMYGTGRQDALPVPALQRLQTAGDALFEGLATAAWVRCTADLELASYDETMALRAWLNAQVRRLLLQASQAAAPAVQPQQSWHDAALSMLGASLADLQRRSRSLVRLTSYTPQGWESVWLISYRLFGTAAWADEILAMNPHVRHPLLVPPGRPLRLVDRR